MLLTIICQAACSPDGKLIVTASSDGTARLWDSSGNPVKELKAHAEVGHAAFSPDGKLIVTAGSYGAARLWSCLICAKPEEMSAAIKRRVGRELTDEVRQFSGLQPRDTDQQPGRSGKNPQPVR